MNVARRAARATSGARRVPAVPTWLGVRPRRLNARHRPSQTRPGGRGAGARLRSRARAGGVRIAPSSSVHLVFSEPRLPASPRGRSGLRTACVVGGFTLLMAVGGCSGQRDAPPIWVDWTVAPTATSGAGAVDKTDPDADTPGDESQRQDAMQTLRKFARCMRDNGVERFPDPDGGPMTLDPSIVEDPDLPRAQQKCADEFLADEP
jgi:hypothetical protein